jgi:capsular exopolysaccharide synthesis family protein
LILVDPARKDLLEPNAQGFSSGSDSAKVDSEVEILRSNSVLLRVIQSENLVQDLVGNWQPSLQQRVLAFLRLGSAEPPPPDKAVNLALQQLRAALTVQRVGATYVLSVQARSADPERAAELSNAIAEAYVAEQLRSKIDNVLSSRDIMQERITAARQNIVASEGAFDAYIDHNIGRIVEDTGRTDLGRLQTQIDQLTESRSQSTALAGLLQANLKDSDFQSIVQNLQDEAVLALDKQRQVLAGQISGAAPTEALNLQAELAAIDEQLRQAAEAKVSELQALITQSQEQEQETRQQLRNEAISSGLSADILTELFDLQQGADLARQQYQRLLGLEQDLTTRASLQVADSRIVSPALASDTPIFPNRALLLAIAAIAALGLGLVLAFAYENFIGGFTSEEQAEAVLKSKVPTAIPRQRGTSTEISALVANAPLSIFAETVRRLRATIEQWRPSSAQPSERRCQVVMVTSTSPNEGKTTVAVSLARSYAISGRHVLLIDADLRKPNVHRQIGIETTVGLLEFLRSGKESAPDLQSIIIKDPLSMATYLLGSSHSDIPTDDLVALPSFDSLITAAREVFDVVVIDTPPIGPVVDGLYIAKLVDTIVFVAKWASTSQRDAKSAINNLKAVAPDAQTLVVLNQLNASKSAYHRKYGGYYTQA